MSHEIMVGLQIVDHDLYAEYRAEIKTLLDAVGGTFRYDFEIARTLKSEASHEINRVFVLQFPSLEAKEEFFADRAYRAIRSRLYESAVGGTTIMAEYPH